MLRRTVVSVAVVIWLVGFVQPAMAQLPPQDAIHCIGTESGGGGVRLYNYDVFNGEPVQLTDLYVATDDLNPADYFNWLEPAGWTHALIAGGGWRNPCLKTPHGLIAPPPPDTTAGWIHWNVGVGNPIGVGLVASFGFDNENRSQNVDWFTAPQGVIAPGANWLSPVGTGRWGVWTDGPVHSPIPEPATLALLAVGAVLGRRR